MEHTNFPEMQQIPPNPNPVNDPYTQFHNPNSSIYPNYTYYTPHPTQNPNPNHVDPQISLEHYGGVPPVQLDAPLQPPGVDLYTYQAPLSCYDAQTAAAAAYRQQVQNWAAATFYQDSNASVSQSLTANEASVKGTEASVAATLTPAVQWTNPVVQSYMTCSALRKALKKINKNKIVQSAYCEVCKIDCNSRDVLDKHKLGKKHKKNLEKIEEAKRIAAQPPPPVVVAPPPLVTPPPPPPVVITNPVIGPQEKPSKKKKSSLASKENLQTKRRKLMDGGAAPEAVRVCTVCNVACNSQTVFNYHLAGQKHASMVKKRAAGRLV